MRKDNKFRNSVIIICTILLIIILAILLFFGGRNKSNSGEEIVIKDNVVVITDETEKELQPQMITENELIFNVDPNYSENDIIVAGIMDSAPAGFIRRVIETTKEEGQYVVKTEHAVLTDVFEEAHIVKNFIFTEDGVKEVDSDNIEQVNNVVPIAPIAYISGFSQYANNVEALTAIPMSLSNPETDYQFSKEFECEIAQGISAKGEVGFSIWLEFQMDISDGGIVLSVVARNQSGGEIFVGCSADAEIEFAKELFSKRLPNIQFLVGTVPIVITNEIQSSVEGKFYVQGEIGSSFEINSANASGFQYDSKSNTIQEVREREYLSDGIEWETGAKASGGHSAGISLHLITKLYDCTGFDIAVGIEEEIKGEICVSPEKKHNGLNYVGSIDMSVYPKLQGNIVVTVPVVDRQLVDAALFKVAMEPFWEYHWDSGDDWEADLENIEESNIPEFSAENSPNAFADSAQYIIDPGTFGEWCQTEDDFTYYNNYIANLKPDWSDGTYNYHDLQGSNEIGIYITYWDSIPFNVYDDQNKTSVLCMVHGINFKGIYQCDETAYIYGYVKTTGDDFYDPFDFEGYGWVDPRELEDGYMISY